MWLWSAICISRCQVDLRLLSCWSGKLIRNPIDVLYGPGLVHDPVCSWHLRSDKTTLYTDLTLGTSFDLFSLLYKVVTKKCARQCRGGPAWYSAWKPLSKMVSPQEAQGFRSLPRLPLFQP